LHVHIYHPDRSLREVSETSELTKRGHFNYHRSTAAFLTAHGYSAVAVEDRKGRQLL